VRGGLSIVPHQRRERVAAVRLPTRTRYVGGGRDRHPVTSGVVGDFPRRVALALGCVAASVMGIVGCTSVTNGTAKPDSSVAPAYRQSVSASVSASSATSSIRESRHQQSLTTMAVRSSCDSFATSSKTAIEKVNTFVGAFNAGRNTGPAEGPAIDALNDSASTVVNSFSDALSRQLKDAFNAYADAAHAVANAIGTHASASEFNKRVNQLNDTKINAAKICVASF
jgi:hypothetical protein